MGADMSPPATPRTPLGSPPREAYILSPSLRTQPTSPALQQAKIITKSLDAGLNPIRREVGVLKTVSVLAKAGKELLWWLGMPGLWFMNFVRLLLFTIVMLPAFLPVFFHYLLSPYVVKNICYGPSIRHQLDVYVPDDDDDDDDEDGTATHGSHSRPSRAPPPEKKPVVVFVTGGAWIIGYKAWSLLMGRTFQMNGVILVSPDYRNFPQGTAETMVGDVTMALQWVLEHCEELGGDPSNITVMGQSAGAHLSLLALLDAAEKLSGKGGQAPWPQGAFARYVGISGPYDIVKLIPDVSELKMHARGLHKRVLKAMMVDPEHYSPRNRVLNLSPDAARLLPPCSLYHGTADATVPAQQTRDMARAFEAANVVLERVVMMEGKSHTDPILEDPAGGTDPLMRELIGLVMRGHVGKHGGGQEVLLPQRLSVQALSLARWFNPF